MVAFPQRLKPLTFAMLAAQLKPCPYDSCLKVVL